MKSVSDQSAGGIAALRTKLAKDYPQFADAVSFEQKIEGQCRLLRLALRLTREKLGIEQSKAAERMQVGQPMISRIENGAGDIGLKTLFRYAAALNLELTFDLKDNAEDAQEPLLSPAVAGMIEEARQIIDRARELLAEASEQIKTASEQIKTASEQIKTTELAAAASKQDTAR